MPRATITRNCSAAQADSADEPAADGVDAGVAEAVLETSVAVAEPEAGEPRTEAPPRKPRPLPPYAVVVLNDDVHSFAYVIETFQKVFGYSVERSYTLAMSIHEQGRGIVWTGPKEVAELKCELIRSAGPDIYATKKVEFPLGALIEPLPG